MLHRCLCTGCKRKLKSCSTTTLILQKKCFRLLRQSCTRSTPLSTATHAINCLEGTKCVLIVTLWGTRGAAHRCNLMYRILKSGWKLPVVVHNLKGYHGHLIAKALKNEFGEVRVIPQNKDKYLSLTVGCLKFINSLQFRPSKRMSSSTCGKPFPLTNLNSSKGKVPIPMTIWIISTDLMNLDCLHRMHFSANCLTVRVRHGVCTRNSSMDCLWMRVNGRLP